MTPEESVTLKEPIKKCLRQHAEVLTKRRDAYDHAINAINETINTGKFNEHSLQALEIAERKHKAVIEHGKEFFGQLDEFNVSHKIFMDSQAVKFEDVGLTNNEEKQFNKVLSLKRAHLKKELQEAEEALPLIKDILTKKSASKQEPPKAQENTGESKIPPKPDGTSKVPSKIPRKLPSKTL